MKEVQPKHPRWRTSSSSSLVEQSSPMQCREPAATASNPTKTKPQGPELRHQYVYTLAAHSQQAPQPKAQPIIISRSSGIIDVSSNISLSHITVTRHLAACYMA